MGILSKFLAGQRQKKIAPYIRGDVLDLGCGNAQILKAYGGQMSSYYGIEQSAKWAQKLAQENPNATFDGRDLDSDPLDLPQKFDCILMIALIEHLFNQKFAMDGVANALKPDGVILITTPTPFGNDVVHRLGATLGLFAKAAVDDHIVIYNRHRFSILANEVGLELKEHRYFQFFCNQVAVLQKPNSERS